MVNDTREPLVIPITEKYRLDSEVDRLRAELRQAESRAAVAERHVASFRRDAQRVLHETATRLLSAKNRIEAAATLRALARRLQLEEDIYSRPRER